MMHPPRFAYSRLYRPLLATTMTLALAACASSPQGDISLVPAQLDQQTSQSGLFSQPIQWSGERPGCKGECPKLVIDSLAFPGNPRLTGLVDHALATMTWLDTSRPAPYDTLQAYQAYYWKTAAPRDEANLIARNRYRNAHLTVIELNVGQYQTGMAHGITGTQFINWDNQSAKALTIDQLLQPGARPGFDAALQAVHDKWVLAHRDAIQDPDSFSRMWPFATSDNVAITDQGVLVKYQSYEIAPYAWGQPELLIPYTQLQGILRPAYLPPNL
ncbi:RsiV family protein [Castellaniella sp.]|uniref:RsiV family protein n=1 Tax=Castellaniella sp. TaxID=1955812 RepID=UPI002AFE6CA0|nr:RsiV family protein [Castellaniella sp.]